MRKMMVERKMQVLGTIGLCIAVTFIIYVLTLLLQGITVAQNAAFESGLVVGRVRL